MLQFTFEECGLFELILLQNSEYIKNNGNFNGEGNAEKAKEVLKLHSKNKALRLSSNTTSHKKGIKAHWREEPGCEPGTGNVQCKSCDILPCHKQTCYQRILGSC